MTLTTRLTLFFLAALAAVLAGFSAALYALADAHLYGQADERLEAAAQTLAAAAEVAPDGVEWEPGQRALGVGPGALGESVYWLLTDERGRTVDRSLQPDAAELLAAAAAALTDEGGVTRPLDWHGQPWRVTRRWVRAPAANGTAPGKHAALAITAAVPLEPVRATLRTLAAVLVGLSLAVLLLATVAGQAVCRRALAPVNRMAESARAMGAADLSARLPDARTGDELADLSGSFNGLLDRLQESFERQRRFTGDASHQLRTPLTAILGQIEVALRRERPAEEYRRVLATVQHRAGHLRRIVESLLFLARADADACLPDRERVSLSEWLPEHVQTWSDHPRAGDIALAPAPDGPHWVEVQPAMLGELLDILIDNACKHSPPGSPIAVHLRREAEAVCVVVEDHGCGIAAEDLPHLFTPFFRSADARRRGVEGLGLGLSIARRLATAFSGVLTVRSHVGEGSCFTLRLPAAERAAGDVASSLRAPNPTHSSTG
jgi:heavy metal sensor kinase